jgi:hypothetical protein
MRYRRYSFIDPKTVTCDVDIAITARMTKAGTMDEDFQYESVRYPILNDLPVVFPRGGGVTLTFPIKEGDECLIVFRRVALISGGRTVGYRKGLTVEFGSVRCVRYSGPAVAGTENQRHQHQRCTTSY